MILTKQPLLIPDLARCNGDVCVCVCVCVCVLRKSDKEKESLNGRTGGDSCLLSARQRARYL